MVYNYTHHYTKYTKNTFKFILSIIFIECPLCHQLLKDVEINKILPSMSLKCIGRKQLLKKRLE